MAVALFRNLEVGEILMMSHELLDKEFSSKKQIFNLGFKMLVFGVCVCIICHDLPRFIGYSSGNLLQHPIFDDAPGMCRITKFSVVSAW